MIRICDIIAGVRRIVAYAPAYSDSMLCGFIDEAISSLAHGTNVYIPELSDGKRTVTIQDGEDSANMPEDFCKELYAAIINGGYVPVAQSVADFRLNSGKVAVIGGKELTACDSLLSGNTDIVVMYYRKPVRVVADLLLDIPEYFNGNSAYPLFIEHYVCWKIFQGLEQGQEDQKVDTNYHHGAWKQYRNDLIHAGNRASGIRREVPTPHTGIFL